MPELNVGLFDVVFVEGVLVGVCQDRRPGILVKFVGDEYFQFAPCSSQWSLFRPGRDFRHTLDYSATVLPSRRPHQLSGKADR